MSQRKPKSSKKVVRTAKPPIYDEDSDESLMDDEYEEESPKRFPSKPNRYISNRCIDDTMEDQPENMDLLDTIDGVDYDSDQFQEDFPHLSREIQNPNLLYPVDAVRWDEKEILEEEEEEPKPKKGSYTLPEELNLKSLLRRCKTEQEALEIIKYFEKREDISSREAEKLITTLQSKGLKALQSKKED